ncbi:hypothetical protein SODALDRAFT_352586 [Sodiomyces alkalinus F11]|uniref:Uncharacterized protein n=1 Tax=Sodiomyces alkalinus (strain CBS 110278 / VKM F-3762 / F11) TaxID=1314773 RepID=A0A3N2PQ62_SODAK|nr:hypothetical protein SODALDRAFT_352586 [Sodiomyces alkalinus F11]ROT36651.1 hypothetical protein SODALDRAFT_352586 [Sodiomyces alkalinus F11]
MPFNFPEKKNLYRRVKMPLLAASVVVNSSEMLVLLRIARSLTDHADASELLGADALDTIERILDHARAGEINEDPESDTSSISGQHLPEQPDEETPIAPAPVLEDNINNESEEELEERSASATLDFTESTTLDFTESVTLDASESHTAENSAPSSHYHLPVDTTEEVRHTPLDFTMSVTAFKMALLVTDASFSRSTWTALVEILRTSPIEELRALPKEKDSLVKQLKSQIPLCTIRKKVVTLDASKLPNRALHVEDLLAFDLKHMLETMLSSSSIRKLTYQGMARFNPSGREMWDSRVWGESLRTTSGQFHRYTDKTPIFPSDFVKHRCYDKRCCPDNAAPRHTGRVTWAGLDYSDDARKRGTVGDPIVFIEPLFTPQTLPPDSREAFTQLPAFTPSAAFQREVILGEKMAVRLPASTVVERVEPFLFYDFDPKRPDTHSPPPTAYNVIRYILDGDTRQFRALIISNPHRGELEIQTYGRDWFVNQFDGQRQPVLSLPWKLFCDAFGVYRNMYRSILGIYGLPAFLPDSIGTRRAHVLPITLVPFGADHVEALQSLTQLGQLDQGCRLTIAGKDQFVCAFPLCFLGDMVQQQELSGCLSWRASVPCRECLITTAQRSNLDFDVIKNGRFYHHMQRTRKESEVIPQVKARREAFRAVGLREEDDLQRAVALWTPALDPFRTRVPDAAHSELTSLVKTVHRILLAHIIRSQYHEDYLRWFQQFRLPPGYKRIQSPLTHAESWRIMECSMASIIVPVILRHFLSPHHIHPDFTAAIVSEAPNFFPDASNPGSASSIVVKCFWNIAKSNLQVCGRHPPPLTRTEFLRVVMSGRKSFQLLVQAAAKSIRSQNPRGRQKTQQVQIPDNLTQASQITTATGFTNIGSINGDTLDPEKLTGSKKALAYYRMKGLLNVHVGLHLWDISYTYGMCRNAFTLLGEDKHREYKRDITKTNHRNAASTLIFRERIRKAMQFGLAGSYETSYPDIHNAFCHFRRDCKTLSIRIENQMQVGSIEEDAELEPLAWAIRIKDDPEHRRPRQSRLLKQTAIQQQDDPLLRVLQPSKEPEDGEFYQLLQKAYRDDYNMTNIPVVKGDTPRWSGRIAFTRSKNEDICFSCGDFVWTGSPRRLARIDGVFGHKISSSYRIFFVLTFTNSNTTELPPDEILGCPVYKLTDFRHIAGLPAIHPDREWIVPREDRTLLIRLLISIL